MFLHASTMCNWHSTLPSRFRGSQSVDSCSLYVLCSALVSLKFSMTLCVCVCVCVRMCICLSVGATGTRSGEPEPAAPRVCTLVLFITNFWGKPERAPPNHVNGCTVCIYDDGTYDRTLIFHLHTLVHHRMYMYVGAVHVAKLSFSCPCHGCPTTRRSQV